MCTALLPSPSDTWTVPAAAPAATTPCPPSAAATGSATAAPARTGDGSTPLLMSCRCGRRFRSLADLLGHWKARHENDWAERHLGQPQPLRPQGSRGVLA